jgi:hypothetical protein
MARCLGGDHAGFSRERDWDPLTILRKLNGIIRPLLLYRIESRAAVERNRLQAERPDSTYSLEDEREGRKEDKSAVSLYNARR